MKYAKSKAKLFVISAPSGCGKTTLCKKLLEDDLGLVGSVSMTTRRARRGERDRADYRFVSLKTFQNAVKNNGFLEYEENFGHLYGTPRRPVGENLKKGRAVLLSIDVKGAMKVRRAYPESSVLVFIMPPSLGALKKRLEARHSDDPASISTRLALAKREMSYRPKYDYVVVNDSLDGAYRRLKRIIKAELESKGV
jgi:guanylate kinase